MKALLIIGIAIGITTAIFFTKKSLDDKRKEKSEIERISSDVNNEVTNINKRADKLKEVLDFEAEIETLMRRIGYTKNQMKDSLISMHKRQINLTSDSLYITIYLERIEHISSVK